MNNGTLLTDCSSEDVRDESVLSGRPNLVHVMVEDEYDVPFWNDLLTETLPNKDFDITPYHYDSANSIDSLTKGKQHMISAARSGHLGSNNIVCVDSDWDYLLEPDTVDADIINQCPYVVQTYVYSVENLLIEPSTIPNVLCNASKVKSDKNYTTLMAQLSEALFPLLILALYYKKHSSDAFTKSDWSDVLPMDKQASSYTNEQLINVVKTAVQSKISELKARCPVADNDLVELRNNLETNKHFSSVEAYKFVRGHDLFEYLLKVYIKPEFDALCSKHFQSISNAVNVSDKEKNDRRNQYKKYVEIPIRHHLSVNFMYKKTSPEYVMMQNAIKNIT